MSDWFKDWFDTEYYHILYKGRNQMEADQFIERLVETLDLPESSSIVDLACGKGRHSRKLNECGYDVLGLDLSNCSIVSAKQFESDSLKFMVHDMRDPIEGQYDAVLNLFTSFGYFENSFENDKVLKAICTYLRPNGILVIDFLNKNWALNQLIEEEEIIESGIVFKIRREHTGTHFIKEIKVKDGEEELNFKEKVQSLSLTDFKGMLDRNGFSLLNVYGDYQLNDFDEVKSKRLILHCKLKGTE